MADIIYFGTNGESGHYPRGIDKTWKSFRLEKKGTDVISVNLNKTLDVNGFVIHKGNIPITHWRRIEKLEE